MNVPRRPAPTSPSQPAARSASPASLRSAGSADSSRTSPSQPYVSATVPAACRNAAIIRSRSASANARNVPVAVARVGITLAAPPARSTPNDTVATLIGSTAVRASVCAASTLALSAPIVSAGQMRVRPVPALADDLQLELVDRRVDHARVRRDRAGGQLRLHVRADHSPHVVLGEHAGGDDVLGPGRRELLARLQHGEQPDRSVGRHRPGQRHQCSEVHVVAAGVHRLAVGREGQRGALTHRQRVQLGPHGDRGSRGRPAPHQPAGAGHRGRVRGVQRGRDPLRRPGLLPGHLRVRVQVVPQVHGRGELGRQARCPRRRELAQAHASSSPYTRRALSTPTIRATRSASGSAHSPSSTRASSSAPNAERKTDVPRW